MLYSHILPSGSHIFYDILFIFPSPFIFPFFFLILFPIFCDIPFYSCSYVCSCHHFKCLLHFLSAPYRILYHFASTKQPNTRTTLEGMGASVSHSHDTLFLNSYLYSSITYNSKRAIAGHVNPQKPFSGTVNPQPMLWRYLRGLKKLWREYRMRNC